MQNSEKPEIAVLIPCYNEEITVGKVVGDFRRELPEATVYVFDNCSTDRTAELAEESGAVVLREPRQGKGFVVERMLDTIRADYYVMVDGDDTYPPESVKELLQPVLEGRADMTVGARLVDHTDESFRPLHKFGNKLVRSLVNWVGKANLTDIMSGYRAFNRRVVMRLPAVSAGFEVETDMTIQMLYYQMKIIEIQVPYRERPAGSESKLNTFRDGFRVLWKIFTLFREVKPLTFFGGIGLVFFALGILAGIPPINDYISNPNHYVTHVPLAILATGLILLSGGFVFLGIMLHSMNWRLRELHNVLTRNRD